MKRPGTAGRQVRSGTTVRTSCGRDLVVSRLRLDGLPHPVHRVVLDIGCQPYDRDEVWVSLTATEARQLARHLVAHADMIEPARPT
jgi:hypothetical protein